MISRVNSHCLKLLLLLLLAACVPESKEGEEGVATESDERRKEPKLEIENISLDPAQYSDDWNPSEYLELLCDPSGHRFIISAQPPKTRELDGYSKRRVWNINELYVQFAEFRRDQGYAGTSTSFETCGDYVVVVQAAAHNWNWRGRGGAHPPFFQVRIANDFSRVYPNEQSFRDAAIGGVYLGDANAIWAYPELDDKGCPLFGASALNVRYDRELENTRVSVLIGNPSPDDRLNYGLDEDRDYTDCSRAVLGNKTSIAAADAWERQSAFGD